MALVPTDKAAPSSPILNGPVGKTLYRLAVPMLLGVLSIVAYNLVDTYFVGQLGPDQLAAIGFTFPVVALVGSLAQGLGVGVTSIVAASYGQGKISRAAHETTDSLLLGMVVVAVVAAVGYFTIDPVFTLLGATPATLPYIREFMEIWYPAVIFLIVPMVGNGAIRATGDTKTPSYIMAASVVLNVVLDPLLIFGLGPFPELGLRGAAIASAIARSTTFFLSLYILYYRDRLLVVPESWKSFWGCVRAVGNISLPASAAGAINPLGIAVLTAILAADGASVVAGYGVGSRIQILALVFIMALSSILGPFVGQNYGVGNMDRIREATRLSSQFSLALGVVMAALLYVLANPIAELFSDDPTVVSVTVLFLRIVPISYAVLGISLTGSTILNALQRPWPAAALAVIQMFVFLVPLAYLGDRYYGKTGVFAAIAVAYALSGLLTWWWVRRETASVEAALKGVPVGQAKTTVAVSA